MTKLIVLRRRVLTLASISALLLAAIAPALLGQTASAAQLTSRKVTLSNSKISTAVTHTFAFTIPTTGNVGSMEFLYCTTPLGICTAPTGMSASAATLGTQTGATGFTLGPTTANSVRITRIPASVTSGTAIVITLNSVTNPSTPNQTFYPRITTYSDASYTTIVDEGVVAGSTAQQLTVNARVQENLEFCVGTTTVNDSSTNPGATCSNITGSTVDIGVIDSSSVAVSPVSTNGGSSTNGVAMVRSNAANGTVIGYFPQQNTGSGKLKIPGATCSGTATTDQCFNSSATRAAFAAGTENFGVTAMPVNTGSTTAYVGANLVRTADYTGDGTSGTGFAWSDAATSAVTIADSSASAVKVLDDEALILRFAATAAATTPTGSYSVVSNYIATSTY